MNNVLKYNITNDVGEYVCTVEVVPQDFSNIALNVTIVTPPDEKNGQIFYSETLNETGGRWTFAQRNLPKEILDLESEFTRFILLERG